MELTDEQLSTVTGGGSGNIPQGGITYSTYEKAYGNRYYAKTVGSTDLLFIEITPNDWANYWTETLIVDTENNTWETNTTGMMIKPPEHLYTEYPYVLNIKP